MPAKDKKIKIKEKETGHFMSILYSIMTYVAVLFQSVQLIPSFKGGWDKRLLMLYTVWFYLKECVLERVLMIGA